MRAEREHAAGPGREDPRCDARELLWRLTHVGMTQPQAAELILGHPNHLVARALDAVDVLGRERITDVPAWITYAMNRPATVDAVLDRHRGWESWHRLRRSWDEADTAHEEQQRRSRGWAAAVLSALDDQQLARAVEKVTRRTGALGRRSLPVARAQLLAWAVAVGSHTPTAVLGEALVADLDGTPTPPDPLEHGLPEAPAGDASKDDLSPRLATAIAKQIEIIDDALTPSEHRPPLEPERTLQRALERGA